MLHPAEHPREPFLQRRGRPAAVRSRLPWLGLLLGFDCGYRSQGGGEPGWSVRCNGSVARFTSQALHRDDRSVFTGTAALGAPDSLKA
jgi:hypothetical protein